MPKRRLIDNVHKGKHRESPKSFWALCAQQLTNVFSQIADDPDLLAKCYSPIRSRDFDEEFIVEITTGIPAALFCRKGMLPVEFMSKNIQLPARQQLYLIVNDVGGGKSTYVHHYFSIGVGDYGIRDKVDGIIVNLRLEDALEEIRTEGIYNYIQQKIHEHLSKRYPEISAPGVEMALKIFKEEFAPYAGILKHKKQRGREKYEDYVIDKLDKSFIPDLHVFNKARIRFIQRGKKRNIFVVLDNVDHYGRKIQEKIFNLSMNISGEFGVSIIMCARDYTIPRALRHLSLSAFDPRFLHLALPDPKSILQKRVTYLIENDLIGNLFKRIGKDQVEFHSASGKSYTFDKRKLTSEFQTILDTLVDNPKIIAMLEGLSNFDMRAMLKLTKVALSSGYLLPDDREGKDIRPTDFLRALMCGNNPYYFPEDEETAILNLFDNNDRDYEGNNLIRLRTLQVVDLLGKTADVEAVVKYMENFQYSKNKVIDVLQTFLHSGHVTSPFHEGVDIVKDDITVIALTHSGKYYLDELIFHGRYLDEVRIATNMDDDIADKIKKLSDDGMDLKKTKIERVAARLTATKLFIEVLESEERLEEARIGGSNNNKALENYKKVKGIINKIKTKYDDAACGILDWVRGNPD